jgi:hypothetical protein
LSRYGFLSPSLHGHYLPIAHRMFILRLRCVMSRGRDAQPDVRVYLIHITS